MHSIESIRIALDSIRANWLRSLLTLAIITVGIAALVGILTAIDGLTLSLSSNLSSIGANVFNISPIEGGGERRRGRQVKAGEPISFRQATAFRSDYAHPAVTSISFTASGLATVRYGEEKSNPNVRVEGVDEHYLDVQGFAVERGRNFTPAEVENGQHVAIIGQDIVKLLFGGKTDKALDATIGVGNMKYRVIGVLGAKGSSFNQSGDRVVLVPVLNAKRYYGRASTNYSIAVAVGTTDDIDVAISSAIGTMRNVRGLHVNQANDFEVETSQGLLDILKENTATIRAATIFIGFITLLGAAIGLMNIMLVSVTERTREIGIRKALGATSRNILSQFLVEAVVICQMGGLVGIVIGILLGNLVSSLTGGTFIVPWLWITIGLIACLVTGLASGIYPAMKAAQLDPIESLRYE